MAFIADPLVAPAADPTPFVRDTDHGDATLELLIEGARCAGCIRKIESAVTRLPGVTAARLNLSTNRLRVAWRPGATDPRAVVAAVRDIGYAARPFDPDADRRQTDAEGRLLLRALAVAGFASMNVMMFSLPVWTGDGEMGEATRRMMHWWSALIAVPAALYAGQPFFRSAWSALRKGRANMDVPISLAVELTLAMSLYETAAGGMRAYFDGACMLLFLLLLGRVLDHGLRQRARSAARDLLALQTTSALRLSQDGRLAPVGARDLRTGDRIVVPAGERTPVNARVLEGASELDVALITGEVTPRAVAPGDLIDSGAVNLMRPLTLEVTAPVENSTAAELARLIEIGEQGRARFVRIADRAAALYVPVVHTLAALTFVGWLALPHVLSAVPDIGVHDALRNAIAVLIITCPCALGLAVPAVQVVATGRLFRKGVLVKSGDALERLAEVNHVVFDKTGTLTTGHPVLTGAPDPKALQAAARLARASRHPLSRALARAAGEGPIADAIEERPGEGVTGVIDGAVARLGRRTFAAPEARDPADGALELWFSWDGATPTRFTFVDALRPDAARAVDTLQRHGFQVELLSGDRIGAVHAAAQSAGIARYAGELRPVQKTDRLARLAESGRRVLMVGDGINDAGALAQAHASMSPGTGAEISQTAADIVFQGASLSAGPAAIAIARAARARVHENLAFSALYNVVAIPVAVLGHVTPLIAALAMAGSSLVVTLNALRLQGQSTWM